jgi:hypothetical protein
MKWNVEKERNPFGLNDASHRNIYCTAKPAFYIYSTYKQWTMGKANLQIIWPESVTFHSGLGCLSILHKKGELALRAQDFKLTTDFNFDEKKKPDYKSLNNLRFKLIYLELDSFRPLKATRSCHFTKKCFIQNHSLDFWTKIKFLVII